MPSSEANMLKQFSGLKKKIRKEKEGKKGGRKIAKKSNLNESKIHCSFSCDLFSKDFWL
jgi:hypothetical protein